MPASIVYTHHHNIDVEKWNNCILNSKTPLVFGQFFYLSATCRNFDALVINNYEAVFPLTQKSKFGISYLHQPPFTPQLGLFGNYSKQTEETVFKYIINKYKLIEIETNNGNSLQSSYHAQKSTHIINYYKQAYKFNQNVKRNIIKAQNMGFEFVKLSQQEAFNLSKIYLNPFLSQKLHLSDNTIVLFENLLSNAQDMNCLYSFKIQDKNGILKAIAHFIADQKHCVYLKGINFDKSENTGSMHLLMSNAIDYFKDKTELFDFGGGANSSLANFYMSFGAIKLEYNAIRYNKLPWHIKLIKRITG